MKEADLRTQILNDVKEYMNLQEAKAALNSGDYIPYASRVYDEEEVTNLVDAALEFWLTSGRYTKEFESKLAEYLNVKYCSFVNSGSSANLLGFIALTSPLLGERGVRPGDGMLTVAA